MVDLIQSFLGAEVPVADCALLACVLFVLFILVFVDLLRTLFRVR